MRNTLIITFAALLLSGCGCGPAKETANESITSKMICGGYTDPRAPEDEELAMFYALADGGETEFTPEAVSTQVVAGINYKFLCRFASADGSNGLCYVTIYKPLSGLSSM